MEKRHTSEVIINNGISGGGTKICIRYLQT